MYSLLLEVSVGDPHSPVLLAPPKGEAEGKSLLPGEKVPRSGGCGAYRLAADSNAPHQSRFARQLLPKEKPRKMIHANHQQFFKFSRMIVTRSFMASEKYCSRR